MRKRLKALGAPVWGTKAQLWPRLVHAEARRELQKRDEQWLADRARELAEVGGQVELRVPRSPEGAQHSVKRMSLAWRLEAGSALRLLSSWTLWRPQKHVIHRQCCDVRAQLAWRRRWMRMLAISCGRSFAASLVAGPNDVWSGTDGCVPDLADLFLER